MSFAQSHADKTMEEPNRKFQCSSIESLALFETPHHLSIHRFNKYLLSGSSMPSTAPGTKDVILVRNSQRANNLLTRQGQGYSQGGSKVLRVGVQEKEAAKAG